MGTKLSLLCRCHTPKFDSVGDILVFILYMLQTMLDFSQERSFFCLSHCIHLVTTIYVGEFTLSKPLWRCNISSSLSHGGLLEPPVSSPTRFALDSSFSSSDTTVAFSAGQVCLWKEKGYFYFNRIWGKIVCTYVQVSAEARRGRWSYSWSWAKWREQALGT